MQSKQMLKLNPAVGMFISIAVQAIFLAMLSMMLVASIWYPFHLFATPQVSWYGDYVLTGFFCGIISMMLIPNIISLLKTIWQDYLQLRENLHHAG